MNKQTLWRGITILLLLNACSSREPMRTTMPKIIYPNSAKFAIDVTPLALNEHGRTISYTTDLSNAEVIQYYVNESDVAGWDNVVIMEPNRSIDLASMKCPVLGMSVLITPTATFTQVSLQFSEEDCI